MTHLRPLNQPQPIKVTTSPDGNPRTITMRGVTHRVARIVDVWRIEDEWWRDRINRTYYRCEMESGIIDTIFRDGVTVEWYRQRV